jgi:excisionase family DNA binding protein
MIQADAEPIYLTPPEVARLLRVDAHSVLDWIRNGELRASNVASRTSTRPRWRVHRGDVDAFLAARAATPPPPRAKRPRRQADFEIYV